MAGPLFQAAPTNSFLQDAHANAYAKKGVPPPDEEGETPGVSTKLLNKQKWKLLETMPGKHSGNTWNMMSTISKGLSPMNKTAKWSDIPSLFSSAIKSLRPKQYSPSGFPTTGTSVQRGLFDNVADLHEGVPGNGKSAVRTGLDRVGAAAQQAGAHIKAHPVGYGLGAGATALGGAGLYGAHQFNKGINKINDTIAGGMQGINEAADDVRNQITEAKDQLTKGPWTDMANAVGSGLAGLFGMQGYAQPQWYQKLINFLKSIFGQRETNKFTDSETGAGGVTTASYNFPKTGSMLLPGKALFTAINGSSQFRKQAAAGQEIVPEQVLNAHLRVADMMEKAAEMMQKSAEYRPFAEPFTNAAKWVRQGYPAKLAMAHELCGSKCLTAKADEVLNTIGAELLGQAIVGTLVKKTASAGWSPLLMGLTGAGVGGASGYLTAAATRGGEDEQAYRRRRNMSILLGLLGGGAIGAGSAHLINKIPDDYPGATELPDVMPKGLPEAAERVKKIEAQEEMLKKQPKADKKPS